jgi:hypothetical protein
MGGDNVSLEGDLELVQNARGIADGGQIGIGTHEDRHQREGMRLLLLLLLLLRRWER